MVKYSDIIDLSNLSRKKAHSNILPAVYAERRAVPCDSFLRKFVHLLEHGVASAIKYKITEKRKNAKNSLVKTMKEQRKMEVPLQMKVIVSIPIHSLI